MAGLVDAPAGSEDLHPVIRYYSFMFGDQKPFISEHVASGRLPLPSSLLIGFGVGAALTVLRVLLDFAFFKVSDFAFFKVSQLIGRWTTSTFRVRRCGMVNISPRLTITGDHS